MCLDDHDHDDDQREKKTGKVSTLNELACYLMSDFISEICFILLLFKDRHLYIIFEYE